MKFSQLVERLGPIVTQHSLSTQPDCDPEIQGIASVDAAPHGTVSYIEGQKFAVQVNQTGASALILPLDAALQAQSAARNIAWISTKDPKLTFAKVVTFFYQPFRPEPGIHPSAVIDPTAVIGTGVAICANAVIQAGAKVGNDVCIHPNVVVYPQAEIGDRTVLHANCVIHERSQIGADCVIHCGAVIGSEGFGFVPTADGWFKLEQSGITVLEDGVEVGCNATIDRPAVGETRISRQTKLDNLVHIGHGCQVGQGVAMAAQVGLAGGVQIGNRVILAGQVGVANQAKIGDGAIASAQSGIHGDVRPGQIVSGSPAMPHDLYLKVSTLYKRLPDIYQAFRQLQRHKDKASE